MKTNTSIATAQECLKDMEKTSYMIAAEAVNNSKPHRRRCHSLFLIFSSFLVGSVFGAGILKLHSDMFDTAFSRINYTAEEQSGVPIVKPAADDKCACDLTDEDIIEICGAPQAKAAATTAMTAAALLRIKRLSNATQALKLSGKMEVEPEKKSLQPPLTHPSYCRKAKCINTDLCSPCQRRFLIIVTTPRSASTTLTWMFDALPGVRMSGENNNTLGFLKKTTDNIVKNVNFARQTNKHTSWGHKLMPNQTLACVNQKMIESISPPRLRMGRYIVFPNHTQDIVGFKTIRFFKDTTTAMEQRDTVRFLKQNFPCSRVIVNINSDVDGQVQSIQDNFIGNGQTQDEIRQEILDENRKLRWLSRVLGPTRAFLIDKNEWTNNVTNLNEAVSWLGFDDACHFTKLLEFNVKGGYGTGRTRLPARKGCKRI